MNLNREDFYSKEIDVLISSSYGPGRYDPSYEERSFEYPLPYVRWTENRNMSEYLELINEDRLRMELLLNHIVKIDDATKAYETNKLKENFPHFTTIIKYFDEDVELNKVNSKSKSIKKSEISKTTKNIGKINIAVVGLGNFAKLIILPNLIKHSTKAQIKALISKNGVTAKNISNEMNLNVLRTSNFNDILNNDLVNTIFILTRHNLHFEMLKKALNDGKNIYIEKPTVINKKELLELNQLVSQLGDDCPIIHTGYNRRFSPHIIFSKEKLKQRSSPLLVNIRVNAGYIDENHWVHSEEGGGRNIGEGCHFYDLMCFLTNSEVKEVSVINISNSCENINSPDNFIVTLKFEDGSIGSITYTSQGSNKISKEYIEMFFDNKTIIIDDFTSTNYYDNSNKTFKTSIQDKGHENQIKRFLDSIKTGKWLIPFNEQFHSADISFSVEKYLK